MGWGGGQWKEIGQITTTHLHKQQAYTSLSPSGIHVDELFMSNREHNIYDQGQTKGSFPTLINVNLTKMGEGAERLHLQTRIKCRCYR